MRPLKEAATSSGLACPDNVIGLLSTTVDGIPGNRTPDDLVRALVGPGVSFANVVYRGTTVSAGTFSGFSTVIGFDDGIILSSGHVINVVGPNSSPSTSHETFTAGDADLDALIPGYETQDATVLEFDIIPTTNTLSWTYVFASEEYDEYVNTAFNDVFGFFVNGTNVALLPTTTTASAVVSINNVNHGNPLHGATNIIRNQQYHIVNTNGQLCTEMDGLTVVLSVTAAVTPHVVNRVKLAIADAGDGVLDSDVFIKAGSLSVNIPPSVSCQSVVTTNAGAEITLNATIADPDGNALTVIWRNNGVPVATNEIPASGSAISTNLSYTAVLPPGTNTVTVVASDGVALSTCGTLVIVPPSTLGLEKLSIAQNTNVAIGEIFQYAISFDTLSNNVAVVGLRLIDQLPPQVDFISVTTNGALSATYNPILHRVEWDFGTWPPLSVGPVNYITVRLNTNALAGATIVNTCTLVSSNMPPVTDTDQPGGCPTCPPGVVVSSNTPPANCTASVGPPQCNLSFGGGAFALSTGGSGACVILSGTATDAEGDPISYSWSTNGVTIATGQVATVCLPQGCHVITMTASDGAAGCQSIVTLCVITPCEAVEQCIELVNNADLGGKNKRPLLASLKAACASFERGNFTSAINQLEAFQNKVRAQIAPSHPAEAQAFIDCVQDIIDAVDCSSALGQPSP